MFFYVAHIITDTFHISICNVHGHMDRSWSKWIHGFYYTLIPPTEQFKVNYTNVIFIITFSKINDKSREREIDVY